MTNKPPPLNRGYNRDPNIQALKKGGVYSSGVYIRVVAPGLGTGPLCRSPSYGVIAGEDN